MWISFFSMYIFPIQIEWQHLMLIENYSDVSINKTLMEKYKYKIWILLSIIFTNQKKEKYFIIFYYLQYFIILFEIYNNYEKNFTIQKFL